MAHHPTCLGLKILDLVTLAPNTLIFTHKKCYQGKYFCLENDLCSNCTLSIFFLIN